MMSNENSRIEQMATVIHRHRPDGVVVIPARNEAAYLARILNDLAAQIGSMSVLVLVCANNCSDATADVARQRPIHHGSTRFDVVELEYSPANVGLLRVEAAAAVQAAGARWFVFTDADVSIPDTDYLATATALVDADRAGCWAGWCDEFGDALTGPGAPKAGTHAERLLDVARRFRGRALPANSPLFRYTDGSNTLVTVAGYRAAGGMLPLPVGGDSTLGDRFLHGTGRMPGFFDRRVVPSTRKQRASGAIGGFMFYPADLRELACVREQGPSRPVTEARAFDALCNDLHAFLCFVCFKRRAWLEALHEDTNDVAARVAAIFEAHFDARAEPIRVTADGNSVCVTGTIGLDRTLTLDWQGITAFWETGLLPGGC